MCSDVCFRCLWLVSPVSHGALLLSPSGASEKRSSSSASEALMDPRALSFFSVCFLLLSAEDPVFAVFCLVPSSADELSRDDWDLLLFLLVCCGHF
ncbi:hypothetical protein NPIL_582101 [Nephila pilipes]|uniref:Uncharacterized protein n=1 Tax=Nephila pilipes TaxID=299642 RepID=A0A8X6TCS1_NEPPI|nr:hypothetical protein NPIL_582101 [Nephila pilipes]